MKKKDPEIDTDIVAEDDDQGNIVPLRLIPGGRLSLDTLPPEKTDWLALLPIGTLFLVGDKHNADYISPEYYIKDKVTGHSLLQLERPQQSIKTEIWVISPRFSQRYFLSHILGAPDNYD